MFSIALAAPTAHADTYEYQVGSSITDFYVYGDTGVEENVTFDFDPSWDNSTFSFTTPTGTTTVQLYSWSSYNEIDVVPGSEDVFQMMYVGITSDDPATNYVSVDFELDLKLLNDEPPTEADVRFTGTISGSVINGNFDDVVVHGTKPAADYSNVELGEFHYNVRVYPSEPYYGLNIGITPVPEPMGLALLALPASALLRRRRSEA